MKTQKLKSVLLFLLKTIAVISGSFWIITTIISTIAFEQTITFVANLLDVEESYLLGYGTSEVSISFIDKLFDTLFFQTVLVLSFSISFLGAILLAKKRSVLAFIGLFAAFIIPYDRERYGKIIDINSQKAIPFATVRLYDHKDNKKIFLKEVVADTGGHYKLEIDKSNINPILEVKASGYLDMYNKPAISADGEITQDIYLSTGLNKTGLYYNFLSKRGFLFDNLTILIYVFTLIFFVIYLYYFLAYPGSIYGIVNFTLFSTALISNSRLIYKKFLVKKSIVLDSVTEEPIVYANVTIFDKDRQLESRYTDDKGRVRFTIPKGSYTVKVKKVGYENWEKSEEVMIGKDGFLKSDISMVKLENHSDLTKNSQNFANPFGQ